MFKAQVDTRNFSFEAYGLNRIQARATLRAGIRRHAKTYATNPDRLIADISPDIIITEIEAGQCYRDNVEV